MSRALEQGTLFTLDYEREPSLLTLRPRGELDFSNAGTLRATTCRTEDGVERVVIDLVDLEFSDVAGIRALRSLRAQHEKRGRLVSVVNVCPIVHRVCTLVPDRE